MFPRAIKLEKIMKLFECKGTQVVKNVKETKFRGNFLKRGSRILGYIGEVKNEGWAYYIGKPSDRSVSRFTGNTPLSKEQAKERLLDACN